MDSFSEKLYVFDESVIDELLKTRDFFKEVLDYFAYLNEYGTITKESWKIIEDSVLPNAVKEILRGFFMNVQDIRTGDPEKSVIKLCNYESQFKETLLITRKEYPINAINNSVKVQSFIEFSTNCINKDTSFTIWRRGEIWKIQKFKGKDSE